ncbi:MAG: hypothetical protein Q9213_001748 [Squamulea squamosa]
MASVTQLTGERPVNEAWEIQTSLSPTSLNVMPVNLSRGINEAGHHTSTSRSIHNNVAGYVTYPGHGPSISDLPFRTIEWGKPDGGTAITSAYAPTAPYATSSSYLTTPRFIVPSTAAHVPAYVRSVSAPARTKRRSASCASILPSTVKVKTQRAEAVDDNKPCSVTPAFTERRASAPSERLRRRSEHFQSWKQKRKDQKLRLKLDGARYGAEQEALFSAHRERLDPFSPRPDVGQATIKEEGEVMPVDDQIAIKKEVAEE